MSVYATTVLTGLGASSFFAEEGALIIEAMRISENNGFTVMHGVVDSLWLSGNGNIVKSILITGHGYLLQVMHII